VSSGRFDRLRTGAPSEAQHGWRLTGIQLHGGEFPVFLLTIYGKSQHANLTKAERNEMKKLVPSLVGGYWKGRQR